MKKANKVVEDAMGGIEKTVKGASKVFGALTASFGTAQLIKLADDYKRFDAQLKLSTRSTEQYAQAYENVIRIGRTAQSNIGAIGVLYARLNNNLRDLNITQKEVSDITEGISLALRVNNATVQETNSVMLQLSQSFGSGRLNGQEFLAVAEGAPILLRQLAKSMNVPFGALKDLSAQSKITREELQKAFTDQEFLNGLRQQVKEVGTVTSSITVLMNNIKQYIGEADKATGATRTLSSGILLISDNINLLVSGALAYGVATFIKWTQGQYAAIAASKLLAKETAQNAQLQILNAEKTALAAKVKSDLLKLELVAEQNKQNAVLKTTQIERLNLIEKIKYEQQTLLVIQAARAEAIAINNTALAKQNDAIRTLESVRNMATLSGTIYAQKQAQDQLNAALAKRGLIMTELANLGRQQASVNAQITASTLALQKAEQALTITEKVRGVNLANNASLTTRLVHDYDKAVNVTNNVTKATSAATTAVRGFGTILSAFGGWIGLAITAVILFGDKIINVASTSTPMLEKIRSKAKEMNEELAKTPEIMKKTAQTQLQQLANERSILEQRLQRDKRALEDIKRSEKLGFGGDPIMEGILKTSISQTEKDLEASLKLYKDFVEQKVDAEKQASRGVTQQQIDDAKKLLGEYKTQANLRKAYEEEVARIKEAGRVTGQDVTAELAKAKEAYDKATGAAKELAKTQKESDKDRKQLIKERAELLKEALEAEIAIQNEAEKMLSELQTKQFDDIESIRQAIQEKEDEIAVTQGLYNSIGELTIARLEEKAAMLKNLGLNTDELQKEIELRRQLEGAINRKAALDELEKARQADIKEEVKDSISEQKEAFKELKQAVDGYSRQMSRSLAEFALSGKKSFGDMINDMMMNLLTLVNQYLIFDPLFKALTGGKTSDGGFGGLFGSIGSAIGGFIGGSGGVSATAGAYDIWNNPYLNMNAKGGVHSGKGISAFSNSIVDKPTMFAFAKGAGLMGEAGAEAIMPLKRDASGKLGVSADGGGTNITVNVIEAEGTKANVQQQQNPDGTMSINVIVEQLYGVMNRDLQRGTGIAPTIERRYGLNRVAGAY